MGLNDELDEDALQAFVDFMMLHHLTITDNWAASQQLNQQYKKSVPNWFSWLIHNYLFIRVPLFRPGHFLNKTYPAIQFLFSRYTPLSMGVLGIIGLFLTSRQWDSFVTTFMHFFSLQGLFLYGVTLIFVKSLHEMGHAFVAKHHGCRVNSMGVAFIVLSPILYTDTTDAWKLKSRFDRLNIVTAGIRVELYLACIAIFLWSFLPDSFLRSAAFFIATTSILTSLLINLSPFMRFDGYYAFSDWLAVENLQTRAFAFGRWFLRRMLFGYTTEAPELISEHRKVIFILYAWFTWIYRLSVFLGIALLVYHFAFKLLGIVLFAIEVGFFIILPIFNEFKRWIEMREKIQFNKNIIITLSVFILFMFLLLFPWQQSVSIPAVLKSNDYYHVYSPEDGVVQSIGKQIGDAVKQGDVLLA